MDGFFCKIGFLTESTIDYLNFVDGIVSYNSGIHLESLISGRPSFSIQLSHKVFDYYGFVEKGLVNHYKSIIDLKRELMNYSESKNFELCKYYYALYDTEKAGKSSEYISKKLKQMFD